MCQTHVAFAPQELEGEPLTLEHLLVHATCPDRRGAVRRERLEGSGERGAVRGER